MPDDIAAAYVFDTRPLTNDRPYFAAYVKPADLHRTLDRLELFQDEWGYLLLWATFAIACAAAPSRWSSLPVIFGWRDAFSRNPGKPGTILYFACLGLGYIMVEVGLIGRFTLALANPTVSAIGADRRHAGLLRPRQPGLGAHHRPRQDGDAGRLPR